MKNSMNYLSINSENIFLYWDLGMSLNKSIYEKGTNHLCLYFILLNLIFEIIFIIFNNFILMDWFAEIKTLRAITA